MSKRVVLIGVLLLATIAPYAMLHPLSWFALGTACYSLILMVTFWLRDRENHRLKTIEENQTARAREQPLIPRETPAQASAEEEELYEKLRRLNILRPPEQ